MAVTEQFRQIYAARECRLIDLAGASGVSESTILNLKRGRNVSLSSFEAVVMALGYRVTIEKP